MNVMPDIGSLVPWQTAMLQCVCGEELSRFGPRIDGMPTLEYRCGHTWGSLGWKVGAKRLPDFAVRDFYVGELLHVMESHREGSE